MLWGSDWWISIRSVTGKTRGAFHLVKNSENSGSGLNGKRFFGSPDWKIPRKSGTAQKVLPFSRLERPNGNLCSIYRISRLYHQFHAFRGLSSLGSLVFPKNGGWSESGFLKLFANKLQGYYECSTWHVLAPDHGNLLQHECGLWTTLKSSFVSTTVNLERREHADVRLLITTHADNKHLFDGKATNKDAFEKIAEQFTKASATGPGCSKPRLN